MLKVARVSTVPQSILSYLHHYEYLQSLGCDVTIICSPEEGFSELQKANVSDVIGLEIKRKIDLVSDLKSVFSLVKILKKNNYDILHSNTPKAAIVSALAGFLAGVPIRIHTFTGQRWLTLRGPQKWLLMFIDWVVVNLNTFCLTDSPSQTQFMIESLSLLPEKISWVHKGSFAGIDFNRFDYERMKKEENHPPRISFLGRVVNDKGICELLDAFKIVREKISNCELLIIGPYEKEHDPLPINYEKRLFSQDGVIVLGHQSKPEEILINTDVFCIPSYREGFGSVVLEAASLRVPSIASDIYGLSDAVENGKTGYLVEKKNVEKLAVALMRILSNNKERKKLGEEAFNRAKSDFSHEVVAQKLFQLYLSLLKKD